MGPLARFVFLYAAMYAAYGVASPFLPALVSSRGIAPEELGLVLGAGTAVRLVSAPLAGRLGDLFEALRTVLVLCIALAAFTTLGYLPAKGFWWFLAISMMQAAALAPIGVLADALTLGAAARARFEDRWGRGTGSGRRRPRPVRVRWGARYGLGRLHHRHARRRPGGRGRRARRDRRAAGVAPRP